MHYDHEFNYEKNAKIIASLQHCADACTRCSVACLDEKDVKMMVACIRLDLDCAAICETSASFAARDSVYMEHILKVCAEICNACAAECEKHAHLEHCRKCAESCRKCAKDCMAIESIAL